MPRLTGSLPSSCFSGLSRLIYRTTSDEESRGNRTLKVGSSLRFAYSSYLYVPVWPCPWRDDVFSSPSAPKVASFYYV